MKVTITSTKYSYYKDPYFMLQQYSKLKQFDAEIADDCLFVTLNDLNDLIKLSNIVNHEVILCQDGSLEIYDDWRE